MGAESERVAQFGRLQDGLLQADEFHAELTPESASADEALVLRQACAGMLWSKQLFYYDVTRWLDGDPGQLPPPEVRKSGRNSKWRNFDGFDIISMPDKCEYPWFAAWREWNGKFLAVTNLDHGDPRPHIPAERHTEGGRIPLLGRCPEFSRDSR